MASKFSENVEAQIVGTIIGGAILLSPAAIFAGAAPLLTAAFGEWATYIIELLLGAATLLFAVVAGHFYFFVLPGGKAPKGSPERKHYDAQRSDLAKGGTAARIYSEKLTAALKAVEHFFRDADSPGQRVLGLKIPAPLWTAEAFHCCLLLALVYPLAMIFLIWTVSGDVGPAEATLGLPSNLPAWHRVATLVAFTVSVRRYWRSQRTAGWKAVVWFVVCVLAGIVVAISLAADTADVAGAIAVTGAVVGAVAGDVGGAALLSPLRSWPVVGALLLFVGLLTLLNAPFVWFSLGLTRALLRRGLERKMWWPYFYALVDAACAVLVIALLACTMVIGIQAFDFLAVRGGGNQILPLDDLFRGIVANGLAPKYWWLYALFLSTMIPSLVNLVIGGLSLTRGIPWLSAHLHGVMSSSGSVSEFHRVQIAALLGSQAVVGVALGIAAQASLVFILLRYAMPSLGVGLLEMAQSVAAFDLPGRIFGLF
jgi:hypothetical protein